MRTSSAWRRNTLYWAASSAAARWVSVVWRIGSTVLMRNGSMIVRNFMMRSPGVSVVNTLAGKRVLRCRGATYNGSGIRRSPGPGVRSGDLLRRSAKRVPVLGAQQVELFGERRQLRDDGCLLLLAVGNLRRRRRLEERRQFPRHLLPL